LTDAQKAITWKATYTPFGKARVDVEQVTNNIRFPGQYFDQETGLHYNYFRDYDPSTGRYLQSDPIGLEGGINTYTYVSNNPLAFIDPFGLAEVVIWGGVGKGSSSFGHVSTNVNGTSYSWGPGGMDIRPQSEYMNLNQDFRSGLGFNLPLTQQQDDSLEQCLSGYSSGSGYNPATNNCGAPVQSCLNQVGIDVRGLSGDISVTPGGIGYSLYTSMPGVTTTQHSRNK
ncbi:RHS repeat-associated core domain-containing protein, partial [Marinimicrobium locisalis]|uniref:RHS repeat-associated core domain-containing protein n=1 Tax=Marinimicrobium locisalis TaxID=546022 RepID=UPI003221EA78